MAILTDFIDSIARRVRDASNTAHSRAFVRDIFTRSAAVINSRQEYAIDEITITAGTAHKALYTVETELGGISKLIDVRVANESLNEMDPWRNLWKLSPTWLTDTASIPLAWAAIGRDQVAIYPAPLQNIPITFIGTRGSFQTLAETEETGFDLENDDIVRELTTALLLLRQRDIDMIEGAIQRMVGKLDIQVEPGGMPKLG